MGAIRRRPTNEEFKKLPPCLENHEHQAFFHLQIWFSPAGIKMGRDGRFARALKNSCKVANYLRIWAAPRKLSANGSTLFANRESRSLMICGWDGNLF